MKKRLIVLIIMFITFIALGLPDALLGSTWTTIRLELTIPLAYLGLFTFILYAASMISTSQAPKLLKKYPAVKIAFFSVLFTSLALFIISQANHYLVLLMAAIPLGMGQGAIDMTLNHYASLHYNQKSMHFLHAFYGVGVTFGPFIMGLSLEYAIWRVGFIILSSVLGLIALLIMVSQNNWEVESAEEKNNHHIMSLKALHKVKQFKSMVLMFLLYVHIESLGGAWIASYMYLEKSLSEVVSAYMTFIFYLGLTSSRILSGLVSHKIQTETLIYTGFTLIIVSSISLWIVKESYILMMSTLLFGFGCGPIYPSLMYLNPKRFHKKYVASIISKEMLVGYMGFGLLTPLWGLYFNQLSMAIYPIIILIVSILLFYLHHRSVGYFKIRHEKELI